jgi:hypothetical protein
VSSSVGGDALVGNAPTGRELQILGSVVSIIEFCTKENARRRREALLAPQRFRVPLTELAD